jgi:hypothetical protein
LINLEPPAAILPDVGKAVSHCGIDEIRTARPSCM